MSLIACSQTNVFQICDNLYFKTLCYNFRYLTEKVVPGNRVTVMGIYSIKKSGKLNKKVRKSLES